MKLIHLPRTPDSFPPSLYKGAVASWYSSEDDSSDCEAKNRQQNKEKMK
jgi:hypothetical protein